MLVSLKDAKEILLKGGNVIVPTETVYGLAGSINHIDAIQNIYSLKGRPKKNPLIVHVDSIERSLQLVKEVPNSFFLLTEAFWPGPLTLIVEAKKGIDPQITGGLATVAIRLPNHEVTRTLIKEVGPIAAPSANLSGKPSSTLLSHLEEDFGKDFPILEGPEPSCGLESTILGWIDGKWRMLRYGYIPKEAIEEILQESIDDSNLKISPGSQFKHYSPNAELFSEKERLSEADAFIGFSNRNYSIELPFYSLGRDTDPISLAQSLFAVFRRLDQDGRKRVWIDADLPSSGIFATILERISKAIAG